MLLAIDVGNTHTVFGHWSGAEWSSLWRIKTDAGATEDQIAAFYLELFKTAGLSEYPKQTLCASVVPAINRSIAHFAEKWLHSEIHFLSAETVPNLRILYDPPHAVGADRIANAIAAKAKYPLPAIVVDFGTATTFDAIAVDGAYLGGSILPGPIVAMEALFNRTAKLPKVELSAPKQAVGRNTNESLQSGLVLGYAGAIDTLAAKMRDELGGQASVIATGGLATLFAPLCHEIEHVDAQLTLNGIRLAFAS